MLKARWTCVLSMTIILAAALGRAASADEFVGPFQSWLNAKNDCGAVGDGEADDTAALQKGLDALRPPDGKRVLYIPAGTYRITGTLYVRREKHSESQGISILGEDPDETVILWDGPQGGVMMYYEAWFARMGRITFDGRGEAGTAVQHGKPFVTANEFADMVFKDVGFGIEAGMQAGIAETAVLRCRFQNCSKAGVSIQNFNSLDWWIRHCIFERCKVGVTNEFGAGHYHVYESDFSESTEADMTMKHCSYFGVRGNFSQRSRAFFVAKRADNWTDEEHWGAQVTLYDNLVFPALDATPVRIAHAGNVLLLDNVIVRQDDGNGAPVVQQEPPGLGDAVSVGNNLGAENPLRVDGRCTVLDDRSEGPVMIDRAGPPVSAPRAERKVFEVPAGAKAADIQSAIDEAAKLAGQRPVVHLNGRSYQVDKTLVIPAGCDVQLVGDGILNATDLVWAGQGEGPVLLLKGPSRATLRDFLINGAGRAAGVVVEKCDQPGAQVFMEQAQVGGVGVGFFLDRLDGAKVEMCDVGHSGCKVGVKAVGGPVAASGKETPGRMAIFGGASSNNALSYEITNGARFMAWDIWYESGDFSRFARLDGAGEFTLHGAQVAVGGKENVPAIELDNFRGKVTLIGATITSVSQPEAPGILVKGDGKDTELLVLGCLFGKQNKFVNESPNARVGFLNNRAYADKVGTAPLENSGRLDAEFLGKMLVQTRTARPGVLVDAPAGVTDVRLYRVFVSNCTTCIHLRAD